VNLTLEIRPDAREQLVRQAADHVLYARLERSGRR
jgi:hypothetical protein